MRQLLASPPGTGKTSHCIELFLKQVLKTPAGLDSRSYFVLPSREHAERIQYLVLKQKIDGLFNAHVLTINDLASRLIGFSSATHPTDALRRYLLSQITDDPEAVWESIGECTGFKGFRRLLLDSVKEFKESLLSTQDFEKLCQPLLKEVSFRSKFRDFSLVLKRYDSGLEKLGLREAADDVSDLVRDKRPSAGLDLVIFDGFYHFTPSQKALISYVASEASQTVVTLTLPRDDERKEYSLFEYPGRTRAFLLSIGFSEKSEPLKINRRTDDPALKHLESNLFLKEPGRFAGKTPSSICVFEASSLRHEVEMIARQIRALYAEEELHYSDICVLLRSLGGYEKVIEDVFRQYDIPVFIHERKKLVEKGLALTLAAYLKLRTAGWKREDLLYLLRSSFLNTVVAEEGVLALEKAAYAKNIREGQEKWAALLSDAEVEPSAKEALKFTVEWDEKLRNSRSAREAGQAISGFLGLLRKGGGPAQDPLAEEIDESLEGVLEGGIDFLRSRGGLFSADSFAQFILDSLDAALFSYRPRGRNRVQVYDVIMALPKEYKAVFVAGLLEKSFPQAVQEDPFFKDAERRVINREKSILEERGWRAGGERYFFYMAVTRAKEKLFLTYPLYDADGRPALASFFISACNKCFGNTLRFVRKSPADFLPDPSEWASDADVTRGLTEALFLTPSAQKSPKVGGALDFLGDGPAGSDLLEAVDWGLRPEEARIIAAEARKLFYEDRALYSATRLEEYATCAFKHFSKRMLHLAERPRNREFLEKGNLLHKTLEIFYGALSGGQKSSEEFWRDEAGVEKLLLKHLDSVLESGPFAHEPLYRQRVFKNSLIEALRIFARREGELFEKRSLIASRFEWAFGMKEVPDSAEPLVLRGAGQPVRLQGRIDRIDLTPDGKKAFIIDYKLSAREKKLSQKWSEGLELQIPIYLLAVSRLLGHEVIGAELRFLFSKEDSLAEGFYRESERQTLGLGNRQKGKTDEEWKALLSEAEERVQSAAAGIRSGDIAVRSKTCKYCDYSSVCRFEKWRLIYSGGSE